MTNREKMVRTACDSDLGAIAALEEACFSLPWSEETLREELALPYKRLLVGEDEGKVVAYGIFSCLFDQWEVERIGVLPACRRQGWGQAILKEVLSALEKEGGELFLEVRASNGGARSLYDSLGFEEYGLRKGYYDRPKEDAVLLRLSVSRITTEERQNG